MARFRTRVSVSIGIPFDMLIKIDEISLQKNMSRSEYVVKVLEEFLNREQENEKF